MFFDLRPKHHKSENQSTPGRPRLDLGSIFMNFGKHFGIDFPTFLIMAKNHEIYDSFTLSIVFDLSKPLILHISLH